LIPDSSVIWIPDSTVWIPDSKTLDSGFLNQQKVEFRITSQGGYSGEYDVCDVTLSVYPHRASLKNMPGHGGPPCYTFITLGILIELKALGDCTIRRQIMSRIIHKLCSWLIAH
jgi:hypothetical protein